MDRALVCCAGLIAALLAAPTLAQSGVASSTIDVSLVVHPSCRVETGPLAFEGQAGNAMDAQSRIVVGCNGDMPVSVSIDGGAHASGSERRLAGAQGFVPYAIYADAGRRVRWDPAAPIALQAGSAPTQIVAYGRIDPEATQAVLGAFSDTLTVTVDF